LIQIKLPLLNPDFTVGIFLQHTKMFHDEFAVFASPDAGAGPRRARLTFDLEQFPHNASGAFDRKFFSRQSLASRGEAGIKMGGPRTI